MPAAPHSAVPIEGTVRIEAFSDGVLAIIVTLLIFEIKVPTLTDLSNAAVVKAMLQIAPKCISFAISFFTVAIFWVNHHHIFFRIVRSNWKLLWLNNLLLFWLTIVPFTTAFIGDHPTQPVVVALYALALCMAALSFSLMGYYVFFRSDLMPATVSRSERRHEWKRGLWAPALYCAAAALAFVWVYAALIIFVAVPIIFAVPKIMREAE
jgi:uncharacterized membrane protein